MRKNVVKKMLALVLAGIMTVGCLAGCGQKEEPKDDVVKQESESAEAEVETETQEEEGPLVTEPFTISILTAREDYVTLDNTEDLWFFNYLEYWMREQGYDVTIEVEAVAEPDQQIALRLGTGDLPDLIWGIEPTTSDIVTYGAGEGIILDWTPYINEETMPNLCRMLEYDPVAYANSICSDGGIYGLPYIVDRGFGWSSGTCGQVNLSINKNWLAECNLEVPETMDDFLDMLRAFKNVKSENGETVPLVGPHNELEAYIWTALGYYGGGFKGSQLAIKDGVVEMACATEDYREFIEVMKTCYEEGLISPDYYTMDETTARAIVADGKAGVYGDYHIILGLPDTWGDWTQVRPVTLGDNDEIAISVAPACKVNRVWASADTEYPEVLAMIMDWLYSDEGCTFYNYGPQEGKDPLNMVDGWFLKEDGTVSTKMVEDGTYTQYNLYGVDYLYSKPYIANGVGYTNYTKELCGVDTALDVYEYTDVITGQTVEVVDKSGYYGALDNGDGAYRVNHFEAWGEHITTVMLPGVYMAEEDNLRATELKTLLEDFVTAETVKFVTGVRSLDEIDDYFEELKDLGVDEYVELYRNAYANYMDSIY